MDVFRMNDCSIVFEYLVNFFTMTYPKCVTILGDHSFLYKDDRDTIIVYVNNGQLIVILDGTIEEVRSVFFSTPIYPVDRMLESWEKDFMFNATYVQPILALL
jgi:hypothetical protein